MRLIFSALDGTPIPAADLLLEAPVALLNALAPSKPKVTPVSRDVLSPAQVRDLLTQLPVEDFREYARWLKIGMAVWCATGGSAEGLAEFTDWSTRDPEYADAADEIERKWDGFDGTGKQNPITTRTLLAEVREAGGEIPREIQRAVYGDARESFAVVSAEDTAPDGEISASWDRYAKGGAIRPSFGNCLTAVAQVGLCPSFNDMSYAVELLGERLPFSVETHGRGWNEATHALTRAILLERFCVEFSLDQVHQAVFALAVQNRYNPVISYLDSCAERWDGTARIDSFLTTYVHVVDSEYVRAASRLLFLGGVWRAFVPGYKYDLMLVLESGQGFGKSKLVQALGGPWAMEDMSFDDLHGKDAAEKLQGKWIVEIAELSMKRTDVEKVKSFLARQTDRYRMPYAKYAQDFPRRCVFIGTTNQSTYLLDPSGNRRFLPVHVSREIDVEGAKRDVDQLWGEAVRRYRSAERPELPAELWAAAACEQAARVAEDPWVEKVEDLVAGLVAKGHKVIARQDLLDALKPLAQQGQWDSLRLNEIMGRIGYVTTKSAQMCHVRGRKVRGFVRAA
jgi:hypothetical protein